MTNNNNTMSLSWIRSTTSLGLCRKSPIAPLVLWNCLGFFLPWISKKNSHVQMSQTTWNHPKFDSIPLKHDLGWSRCHLQWWKIITNKNIYEKNFRDYQDSSGRSQGMFNSVNDKEDNIWNVWFDGDMVSLYPLIIINHVCSYFFWQGSR